MKTIDRLARPASLALAVVFAVVGLAYVAAVFVVRPKSPVEAELVFEAIRVGRGYALYVDPWVGAWEHGAPPSRYYVLYTPLWPWVLGKLGGGSVALTTHLGRGIAMVCWVVAMFAPVAFARRESRRTTAIAAMLAVGILFLERSALAATPEATAAVFTSLGLSRAIRRGRIDAWSAALLVCGPFFKPSALGAAVGAFGALVGASATGTFKQSLRDRLTALGGGAIAFVLLALACQRTSDGHWLEHIVRSTGQPLTFTRWVEEFGSRVVILGLPHLVMLAVALKRRAPWATTAPLAASFAWSTFAMAKHGSGTQYWLEPTVCALVSLASLPPAPARIFTFPRVATVFGVVVGCTSIPVFADELSWASLHAREVAAIGARCPRQGDDVVVSDDAVLELALDGRLIVPDWQSSFLARAGKFPLDEWKNDLRRQQIRCLVLFVDPRHVPRSNDERIEISAYQDLLRDVVDENYRFDGREGRAYVFRPGKAETALTSD